MRPSRAIMTDLAASGMSPEQIALVMELSAAVSAEARPAVDEAAERRRERDREYQAAKRDQRRQKSADSTDAADAAPFPAPPNENNLTPPTHTPVETPRARKAELYPCPEGVDPDDWDGLLANRKAQKAPMTKSAYQAILRKLSKWADDGWPPGPIVANAVERGWRTVFETDEMKGRQNGKRTDDDKIHNPIQAAIAADRRAGVDRSARQPF